MSDRSAPYLLRAGATRVEGAILPFKVLASDSAGLISMCEFTLPGWSSGPVLHSHDDVDEGHYVISGTLEVQLGDQRLVATAGDFEHLFAEQWQYLSSLTGPADPAVMDEIGRRHRSPTLGPPITAAGAPEG